MKRLKVRMVLIFALLSSELPAQRVHYPDLLRLQCSIKDTNNIEKSCFSDLGAWHGYALPESKNDYGSFIGPLLMDLTGQWLANNLAQLTLYEQGVKIHFDTAKASIHYYPGMLEQLLETQGLEIKLRLIFVSNRESLLHATVKNLTEKERKLELLWKGTALLSSASLQRTDRGIQISFVNSQHLFEIVYQDAEKENIYISNNSYLARNSVICLKAGGQFTSTQLHRFFLHPGEKKQTYLNYNFSEELKRNEIRWNGYLSNYFLDIPNLETAKKRLAVKAILTLITNWRSKAKDLLHDGVFPSINYQGFYGFWSWDSWKQAVGLSLFHPQLAKENILCMFDYQDKYGMIADCIYTDQRNNNWRDTKPPLAAWAVWNIYKASKDIEFVKEIYPRLVKYHLWWYKYRDNNRNGLCEYGSTDGSRIAAAWESGMDNAVRFDSAILLNNSLNAWSLNQESVDLNAYLYAEKLYLSKMALILQKNEAAVKFKNEARRLALLINKHFFDKNKGFYYDRPFKKYEKPGVEGPEGWIPMWAGISSPAEIKGVMEMMQNPSKFNTEIPLPSLAADHPKFDPLSGYWRGPVWLDQFYFGITGLKRSGYTAIASDLTNKLWKNAAGLLGDAPIFENYHPLSGQGLNAINFSWSAAHILLLLKN